MNVIVLLLNLDHTDADKAYHTSMVWIQGFVSMIDIILGLWRRVI